MCVCVSLGCEHRVPRTRDYIVNACLWPTDAHVTGCVRCVCVMCMCVCVRDSSMGYPARHMSSVCAREGLDRFVVGGRLEK